MANNKLQKIIAKNIEIVTFKKNESDFISLTDIAKYKDKERTNYVIQNWIRNRNTIEFLGLWERLDNPSFNSIEFDAFKNQAGLNSFSLTPQRWIEKTNAIGLISKSGRYGGGTFAHKDIAFEFAAWISSEFRLFIIKDFQRLKDDESKRLVQGWDIKRTLSKINYKIHTDAIKDNLIPSNISKKQTDIVYASEGDVLNVALFGKTAKEWRLKNSNRSGNIRDYADVTQLIVLSNLEGMNAELIRQKLSQPERLIRLNQIAITQMRSLLGNQNIKRLT